MKLTREKLRQIIKEELSELMAEENLEEEVLEEDDEDDETSHSRKSLPREDPRDRQTADLGDKRKRGKNPTSRGPKGEITRRNYRDEYDEDPTGYLGHS